MLEVVLDGVMGGKAGTVKTAAVFTEDSEDRKQRLAKILKGLHSLYPDAHCELTFDDSFQLLVATILSAQSTDKRVNMVTPELFAKYPNANALAQADQADVERIIHSTGFYRNKAKHIIGMSQRLMREYDGKVPRTLEELIELPGVARKTANVVLGSSMGIASGVVVDTHVMRLSKRLGLTESENPVAIEQDLMAILPEKEWVNFSHRLIWHGRRVCDARRPRCEQCPLLLVCPAGQAMMPQ